MIYNYSLRSYHYIDNTLIIFIVTFIKLFNHFNNKYYMMKINNPAIDLILDIADTKQASDVLVLDVSEQCDFSDLFIIMSAETKRQIKSIVNDMTLDLKNIGYDKKRIDGIDSLEWVVVDYGDFIVHVFDEYNREKYSLETVWEKSKEIIRIH